MEIVVPDEFKYLYEKAHTPNIVKVPNKVLRSKASDISKISKKTLDLIDSMTRIMKNANGVGLAAPQLGIFHRVIVIAPMDMKPTPLVNPKIIRGEGEQVGVEGCLSIPGLYGDVKRYEFVEVDAQDRKGRRLTFEMEGMMARVVQHEIDHLDGVLFTDKVDIATLHWAHPEGEPQVAE